MDISTINTVIGGAITIIGIILAWGLNLLNSSISRLVGRIDNLDDNLAKHHDTLSDIQHRLSNLEKHTKIN